MASNPPHRSRMAYPPRRGPSAARVGALAFVLALAVAGCGSSTTASTFDRYLFTQNCAPCHSLDPRSGSPDPLAPNLATRHYVLRVIEDAVLDGGRGMPPKILSGSWLSDTARYIRANERH